MNGFMSLLASYYLCGAVLGQDTLPHELDLRCAVTVETVGIAFLSEEERDAIASIGLAQGPMMHDGLLRFQEWEADHAALVEAFEDAARAIALTMR